MFSIEISPKKVMFEYDFYNIEFKITREEFGKTHIHTIKGNNLNIVVPNKIVDDDSMLTYNILVNRCEQYKNILEMLIRKTENNNVEIKACANSDNYFAFFIRDNKLYIKIITNISTTYEIPITQQLIDEFLRLYKWFDERCKESNFLIDNIISD